MVTGRLPDEGPVQIGSVRLPAGVHIVSGYGTAELPVAWATTEPVPDAGRVWAALSQAHAGSGLVPFVLSGIGGGTERNAPARASTTFPVAFDARVGRGLPLPGSDGTETEHDRLAG